MATSSIFTSFDIHDKKTAEAFVTALDESAKDPKRIRTSAASVRLTNTNDIKNRFSQRKKS